MKIKLLLLLILLQTGLSSTVPDSVQKEINGQLEKYKTLLEYSYTYHKDSIDLNSKSDVAFNSFLQAMDSKSYYFTTEQYKTMKSANTGVSKSTGLTQIVFADTSYVFRVEKKSSADSNKIKPGWRILSISNESVIASDEVTINSMLADTSLTSIEIEFLNMKGEKVTKTIMNSPHVNSSIELSYMINDSTGYIKSLKFTANASNEFENVISNFPYSMNGLVIDLRNNPGGVLTAIGEVISLFIDEGKQVIKTESKHPDYLYNIKSKKKGKFKGLPLVLIVNEVSASASELFAGAVQDYDLGIVIGQRTYGKGTLQKHWEFKDGSAFRVTVGEYVTPLGRKVQKNNKKAFDPSMESFDEDLNEKLRKLEVPQDVKIIKSSKGRDLISMGGILPDSITTQEAKPTKLTTVAKQKRVFIKTAFEIFLGEYFKIKNQYNDFLDFCKQYNFNDEIYTRIKKNLIAASLQNDEMFNTDKSLMAQITKERLGQLLYGDEAYYCTESINDIVVIKASNSLNDAKKLVRGN